MTTMDKDEALRKHLVSLLRGGQAYDAFEDVTITDAGVQIFDFE